MVIMMVDVLIGVTLMVLVSVWSAGIVYMFVSCFKDW